MQKKIINNIHRIISKGVDLGIGQLYTEDEFYNKTTITFDNKKHINFGSYSYLGLEHDIRLKEAAVDSIMRYGIQFPSSRTYVSSTPYREIEMLMEKIFNAPIVLSTTTTLAHISAMPVILEEGDVVIMDQHVHSSVQFMVTHMKQYGIPFHILRHNNMEQLEEKVVTFSKSYKRIWYMFDGVYSMYGDPAPMEKLNDLINRHRKLHLYADDAHGMSWTGKNGSGYVLNKMPLNERLIVITSLNKAFAAGGAVMVVPDQDLANKIKTCGGPLIFAGQHQMSSLGASIASAKIHLSNELEIMQNKLMENINYCHELLIDKKLPVVSDGESPIFFIGVGLPRVGYNLVDKMIKSRCYVNLAIFPAVSETCTGIRFSLTKNHTKEQIKTLVDNLGINFKQALEDENRTLEDIYKAFRKVKSFDHLPDSSALERIEDTISDFTIQYETSIDNIREEVWNSLLGDQSTFDWEGLRALEHLFSHQNKEHNNWNFHYYIVRNQEGFPVFVTYLTECLTKDDALAHASISRKIEQERDTSDSYYLCSKVLLMGCPLSMGIHYYLNMNVDWKGALTFFFDFLTDEQSRMAISTLNLRDFKPADSELTSFVLDQGFIHVDIPSSYELLDLTSFDSNEEFLSILNSDKRRFVKKRAIANESSFLKKVMSTEDVGKIEEIYQLYLNVKEKSFELNLFDYPINLFSLALNSPNWEILLLQMTNDPGRTAGCALNYINRDTYHFLLAGLDYELLEESDVYSQLLWQIVKRANELNCTKIQFGATTGQNKRKFGAIEKKNIGFVRLKDDYNAKIISLMSTDNRSINEQLQQKSNAQINNWE